MMWIGSPLSQTWKDWLQTRLTSVRTSISTYTVVRLYKDVLAIVFVETDTKRIIIRQCGHAKLIVVTSRDADLDKCKAMVHETAGIVEQSKLLSDCSTLVLLSQPDDDLTF